MKNILFITSNSLATNPRLVKEIRACLTAGHKASVISFAFNNWSKDLNDRLINEFDGKVNLVLLPGDRSGKRAWLTSTCISLVARFLSKFFPGNLFLASLGFSKRTWLLLTALKKQKGEYDFVIAHNPGAFVPAYAFAAKKNLPLGIDVEDFHPGESDDQAVRKSMEGIMKSVLGAATVVTFSSPLIFAEAEKYFPAQKLHVELIRNVFSRTLQPVLKQVGGQPLKLVWFSQTVGLNRGIQDAIKAMNLVAATNIQLTIIGHCNEKTKQQLCGLLENERHSIKFLAPLPENELTEECSRHHIGLALEPGFSLNNELALSNKIFTYLLAGNALIASETKAQKAFIDEFRNIGSTYPIGHIQQLAALLARYATDSSLLQTARENAYRLASEELNWETESKRFLAVYGLEKLEKCCLHQ